MAKIKQTNSEGVEEEVEVFTPQEVDQKLKEKDTEWETKLSEKDTNLQKIETEKKELETKLDQAARDGIKEDHPNFKVLKEALSKKDGEIQSLRTDLDNDRKTRTQEAIDSKIKILSKGDVELEKKMKLHLENTLVGMKDGTAEERQKKIEAAYKLSSDHSTDGPGMFDEGVGGGGSHRGVDIKDSGNSSPEFSSREKALGAKLGITNEDYKKYGPRVSKR